MWENARIIEIAYEKKEKEAKFRLPDNCLGAKKRGMLRERAQMRFTITGRESYIQLLWLALYARVMSAQRLRRLKKKKEVTAATVTEASFQTTGKERNRSGALAKKNGVIALKKLELKRSGNKLFGEGWRECSGGSGYSGRDLRSVSYFLVGRIQGRIPLDSWEESRRQGSGPKV